MSDSLNTNNLTEQLTKLKTNLQNFKDELIPIKNELSGIYAEKDAAKQAYLAALAAIAEKESELTVARNEHNRIIRNLQNEQNSLERQLEQLERLERLNAKVKDLEKQLDEAAEIQKWFTVAFEHQFTAAKHITKYRRLILADKPGLGKTLSALAACDLIKVVTANARPDNPYGYDPTDYVKGVPQQCGKKILYICPAPLINNVLREVRLWSNKSVTVLGKQPKQVRRFIIETLEEANEYIVIINFEAWRRDKTLLADLKKLQFDTIIVDEAHALKNTKVDVFKDIKSLIANHNSIPIQMEEYSNDIKYGRSYLWNKVGDSYIPFIIVMTGTPILNKPQDLFSLLTLVDPDNFRFEHQFLSDYCIQNSYTGKWEFKQGGLASLAKRISNVYLRRTKEDVGIVLPGKHEKYHYLELDPDNYPNQTRARNEMKKYGAILLAEDTTITAAAEIAIYTRLRQIETWPAGITVKDKNGIVQLQLDVEESQKLDYVLNVNGSGLLADLTDGGIIEGNSCVVFSQFTAPLHELYDRCTKAGISAVILDGTTSEKVRDEIIKDFDRRHTTDTQAKWQVVLANYRVGGVGVTLTRATEMIMLDAEWSAGREEQATDRIHRIGQTENVTIHKILVEKTIDSWMEDLIKHKKNMTEGFNDAVDMTTLREKLLES